MCYRYYLPGKIKLFLNVWSTTGISVLHAIWFFENQKWNLSAKQQANRLVSPCIWKKENFLYNYFGHWVTIVAKKNILSVEFLLPKKKPGKKWCGKTRNTSWKLKSTSLNSKVQFQIRQSRVQVQESKFTSYKFKYKFREQILHIAPCCWCCSNIFTVIFLVVVCF